MYSRSRSYFPSVISLQIIKYVIVSFSPLHNPQVQSFTYPFFLFVPTFPHLNRVQISFLQPLMFLYFQYGSRSSQVLTNLYWVLNADLMIFLSTCAVCRSFSSSSSKPSSNLFWILSTSAPFHISSGMSSHLISCRAWTRSFPHLLGFLLWIPLHSSLNSCRGYISFSITNMSITYILALLRVTCRLFTTSSSVS